MSGPRKKPSLAFWATVVLALVLAYPLSQGPAMWIVSRIEDRLPSTVRWYLWLYWPLIIGEMWLEEVAPEWVNGAISWYLTLGMPDEMLL